jgi:hypothetical protein
MKPKKILFWAGVAAAAVTVIISIASLDDKHMNPISAVGMGLAALALFRGSELS